MEQYYLNDVTSIKSASIQIIIIIKKTVSIFIHSL